LVFAKEAALLAQQLTEACWMAAQVLVAVVAEVIQQVLTYLAALAEAESSL
jgi:hypothetical protein